MDTLTPHSDITKQHGQDPSYKQICSGLEPEDQAVEKTAGLTAYRRGGVVSGWACTLWRGTAMLQGPVKDVTRLCVGVRTQCATVKVACTCRAWSVQCHSKLGRKPSNGRLHSQNKQVPYKLFSRKQSHLNGVTGEIKITSNMTALTIQCILCSNACPLVWPVTFLCLQLLLALIHSPTRRSLMHCFECNKTHLEVL